MDHMPYPNSSDSKHIEVPFLCDDSLDAEERRAGLVGFPYLFAVTPGKDKLETMLVGPALRTLLAGLPRCEEWYNCSPRVAAYKAQKCIYFSILREVVGSSFRLENFVHTSETSQQLVVSLTQLKEKLHWECQQCPDGQLRSFKRRLRPHLRAIYEHARYLRSLPQPACVIGLSLEFLVWSATGVSSSEFGMYYDENDFLRQRMLACGWCPYWTKVYHDKLSSPLIYYLSGMRRSSDESHASCSSQWPCKAYNVDRNTYQTKHAPGCNKNTCSFIGPDLEKLGSIVAKGGIPLIRISKKSRSVESQSESTTIRRTKRTVSKGGIKIDVVEHAFGRPFIAISHVWAGGLGHFDANTLPQCQLAFLYEKAQQCDPEFYSQGYGWFDNRLLRFILGATSDDTTALYIWIDTLCIPADPQIPNQSLLCKQAIDKMAMVYAMAIHVLVIDAHLQKISVHVESEAYVAVQLMNCPWMTRSWTFQEACLARKFSFLLRDTMINPRRWSESSTSFQKRGQVSVLEKLLVTECLESFRNIPEVLNVAVSNAETEEVEDPESFFISVWNQLATRQTSLPEDLHGILAVMLRLSAKEILVDESEKARDGFHRMLMILRAQVSLPLCMLYLPCPNSSSYDGYEWAPRIPSSHLDVQLGTMKWTEDGLGLRLVLSDTNSCAFVLDYQPGNSIIPEFYIFTEASSSSLGLKSGSDKVWIQLKPSNPERIPTAKKFGIVLHGLNGEPSSKGACFGVVNDEDPNLLRLKFIAPLEYRIISSTEKLTQDVIDATIKASLVSPSAACIVELDRSMSITPKWRRMNAYTLQRNLVLPIGLFTALYWAVVIFNMVTDHMWRIFYPELIQSQNMLRIFRKIPLIRGMYAPDSWFYRNAGYIYPFSIYSTRILVLVVELTRLVEVNQRVRYERFANSFDYTPADQLSAKESHRLDIEFSYQFPHLWLLVSPMAAMFYFYFIIPPFWTAASEVEIFFGKRFKLYTVGGACGEVIGRIAIETLWRYFMLDLKGRRRRLWKWERASYYLSPWILRFGQGLGFSRRRKLVTILVAVAITIAIPIALVVAVRFATTNGKTTI